MHYIDYICVTIIWMRYIDQRYIIQSPQGPVTSVICKHI